MGSKAGSANGRDVWKLRLYVAGLTPKSLEAFANLKSLCEAHLKGRYAIEVIDLIEFPELARIDQILAIPTLVRRCPKPACRIIGDLSDTASVMAGLDIVQMAGGENDE